MEPRNWISETGYVHQPPISSREECEIREGVCSYCREHCELNDLFSPETCATICHSCRVVWEYPRAARPC
jgi:hypothetical protein